MEFDLGGNTYRVGEMDTFKQFHVSRRLAPVLSEMVTAAGGPDNSDNFATFLQPIAEAVAKMSDADCDFILQSCLTVVQRQQGNAWAAIYAHGKQALMFDDIDLATMMQIAARVIQENLGGFFRGGVAALNKSESTAAA